MNRPSLAARVRAYIDKHRLITPGDRVLVAVSGGVDSMVLLHVLKELGHEVHVAHFDHKTREGASARDAQYVVEHCKGIGMPCEVGHWERTHGHGSLEMRARKSRYQFLAQTAIAHGCTVIATGHHADDQAETVLFRALRGTGPEGLAGIAPSQPLFGQQVGKTLLLFSRTPGNSGHDLNLRLVRPLLGVKHADIETFARDTKIDWRTDSTNTELRHQRNWIRHELLPRITQDLNPQASTALNRLAESMRCENDLIDTLVLDAKDSVVIEGEIQRGAFAALHEAIQRRILRRWILPADAGNSHDLVTAAVSFVQLAPPGNEMSLDEEHYLYASRDAVRLYVRIPDAKLESDFVKFPLPGECDYHGRHFRASLADTAPTLPLKQFCTPSRQVFDADKLELPLGLMTRAFGNRFVPLGMMQEKKLQDYFVDRHVPRPERDQIPLLFARGEIAWVVGHAPSAKFAVTPQTKRFAIVEIIPCD